MGVSVMIVKFINGQEQSFSKAEIDTILANYAKEKGQIDSSSGIDFLIQQPWFEHCEFIPDGDAIAAILISKPHIEETALKEVIFRLLEIEHSVLMSEHFDLFHSRTDMKSHFPSDIKQVMEEMANSEDDLDISFTTIQSATEVWPDSWKIDDDWDDV